MKRTNSLATLFSAATVTALVLVATALVSDAAGDDDEEEGQRAGGGSAKKGQIVFRRYLDADQTKGALFVVNPDGGQARRITHAPKGWKDNVPAWSPDGTTIVFERFKSDESTSRIMVVDPDTGDTHAVVPCTGATCLYAIDPYFSPDGDSVAYSRTVAPPGSPHPPEWKVYSAIFIVGVDGSHPHQVTSTPERHQGKPAGFEDTDPTFSPDGTVIAYIRTRYRPQQNSAVFVQPIGAPEDARRISPWKMNCQDRPTFSPDGKLVLFRCMPQGEEGPSNLYWVHPDGTGLHQITHAASDKQYLGSGFAPNFQKGQGWITAGRTGGFGEDGNADVFRILVRDGKVARLMNLTKSEKWDSAAGWGIHAPVG